MGKIHDLFKDREKWTQGVFARDEGSVSVRSTDPDAVCWCLEGAVIALYYPHGPKEVDGVRAKINTAITLLFPEFKPDPDSDTDCGKIIGFNDTHSYEEVMQVLELADV